MKGKESSGGYKEEGNRNGKLWSDPWKISIKEIGQRWTLWIDWRQNLWKGYGFNSPVLWTSHIRCFNDLRLRENVILMSISFSIGHISQKGWGQDSKSQQGRGDCPGTSVGTLAAVTAGQLQPPTSRKTTGELCPLPFPYPADGQFCTCLDGDDASCTRGGADEPHTQSTNKPTV